MKHKREQSKIWSEYKTINESMGAGGLTSFTSSAVPHSGEDPNKDVELPGDHPNLFADEELASALKDVETYGLQTIQHYLKNDPDALSDAITEILGTR
jgi:hypothetical protein